MYFPSTDHPLLGVKALSNSKRAGVRRLPVRTDAEMFIRMVSAVKTKTPGLRLPPGFLSRLNKLNQREKMSSL
jgi:hypothetical protein